MTARTPGPSYSVEPGDEPDSHNIVMDNGYLVATVFTGDRSDALKMAAADDLVAALRLTVEAFDFQGRDDGRTERFRAAANAARAALAKAGAV